MNLVKKILRILFWIILIIIAIYSTVIIFQKIIWKDKVPNFFGYKNFIVLTGSMEPTLNTGDIVFVKETPDIKEQDIISFRVNNSIVTHRVVKIKTVDNNTYYATKGDANSDADTELVSLEEIEGKYIFKIPFLGNIINFFQKPMGIIILVAILIGILFLGAKKRPKHMKGEDDYERQKDN